MRRASRPWRAGIRRSEAYHACVVDPVPNPPPPPRTPVVRPGSWSVRLGSIAALAVAGAAVATLARHHPHEFAFLPPCPSASLGFACAGCGSTRAVHFLLQGDLSAAWRHNPILILVGIPFAAVAAVSLIRAAWTGRWPRSPLSPQASARLGLALVILILGWTLVRNLPGETFSGLRPPASALPA